jgi:dTDP-4-amino-4,6-dideoxygalactose transaminase
MKNIPLFKVMMTPNYVKLMADLGMVLYSGRTAEGAKVKEFEQKVNEYIGNPNGVSIYSCTSALTICLKALGVGPDTEVISTPLTCVATNLPIIHLGAKLVWADVDVETGAASVETIRAKITDKTKAIIVMHKEGDPIDLDGVLELAHSRGIKVIEDAAHAFGAEYKGKKIGNHGDLVCFSFQSIKQLTSVDGGYVFANDPALIEVVKRLRYFGIDRDKRNFEQSMWDYDIVEPGYKANMNEILATIGLNNLEVYESTLKTFTDSGKFYLENLQNIDGISHIKREKDAKSSFWTFCMQVDRRQDFVDVMRKKGVQIGYSHSRNDVYSVFSQSKTDLPNLDEFVKKEISLPCHVEIDNLEYILECIKAGW